MQATRKQRGCSRGKAHLELDRAVFSGIRRTKLLPRGVFRTRKHPQSSGGARGGKARLELDSAVFSGIRRRKPPRSFGSRAAPQLREWGMQHAHDSAVLSERILADEPPQECRALGARRRALRVEAIAVLAVENTVFHGPGQRRTGIAADSARIGKAAQGIFRLRFIRSTRKAGITVKDGGQILPADRLRGAERIGAAAADHTGMIGPGNGEYCYTIAARTGEILDVQRPEKPAQTPDTPDSPTDSEISISEALRRVLQELGVSQPEIRDVDVQRVHVGGRDAYHITFTANGNPYSFYVDAHDGDIF